MTPLRAWGLLLLLATTSVDANVSNSHGSASLLHRWAFGISSATVSTNKPTRHRQHHHATRRMQQVSLVAETKAQLVTSPTKETSDTGTLSSKQQKNSNILRPFLHLSLFLTKRLALTTARGFCFGYLLGTVVSLYGLIRDAWVDHENGLPELHQRSFRWAKVGAKIHIVIYAITMPCLFFVLNTFPSKLDRLHSQGKLSADQYQQMHHILGELNKKVYGS